MGKPVDFSATFTGAGQRSVPIAGRFLRVLAADASGVSITPGGSGSGLLRIVGQDVDAGETVKDWLIAVTVACTVKVCVSDQRQADNASSITATVSATVTPGGTLNQPGDVACPNGAATQLLAGNANRLSAIIRGSSAGAWADGTVRLGTTAVAAASGVEINPGDAWTIDDTAPVFAYNNSGASIDLQVMEVAK